LEILGRDPALKRLYLVRSDPRDLADYLAERRFLLGLDVLELDDTTGAVVADGATASTMAAAERDTLRLAAAPIAAHGIAVADLEGGAGLAIVAHVPILYENQKVGVLRGGQ